MAPDTAAVRAHEKPYDVAVCGLPGCGKPLHIVWTMGRTVYLADTAADLADPSGAHTSTWQVECEGGHTILVPIDSAEDSYTFGECNCEPTDPNDDEWCGHADMDRLRRVIGEGFARD